MKFNLIVLVLLCTLHIHSQSDNSQWNSEGDNTMLGTFQIGDFINNEDYNYSKVKQRIIGGGILVRNSGSPFLTLSHDLENLNRQYWVDMAIAGFNGSYSVLAKKGDFVLRHGGHRSSMVFANEGGGDYVFGFGRWTAHKEGMRFTRNGYLGIGTSTPSAFLHINNKDNSYGAILANANESPFSLYTKTLTTAPVDTESFRLGLKYNNNENNGFISFYRGQGVEGGFLGLSTNGQERIRISREGKVGIGTDKPQSNLSIAYNSNASQIGLKRADGAENVLINVDSKGQLVFKNNSGGGDYDFQSNVGGNGTKSVFHIDGSYGKVGINKLSPSKDLDVNGDIQLSGSLYKNNLELNINNLVTTKYRVNMHSGGFIHGVDSNGKPAGSSDSSYRELPEGITSGTYSWWNYGRTKGQPGSYGAAVGFGDGKRGSAEIWSGWTSGKLYTRFLRDCCQGWSDWNQIWTSNSDGENSGMDADTVDGLQPILEQKNGTVGIGTTDTRGYKLAVDGDVVAEEVKVQLSQNWASVPDYVFKKSYDLATLAEVESYIEANGHLENIPSATEIEKAGGINVGEMNMKLLEKIEELTLYIISQNKQIAELKKDNERVDNLELELKSIKELLYILTQNKIGNTPSR